MEGKSWRKKKGKFLLLKIKHLKLKNQLHKNKKRRKMVDHLKEKFKIKMEKKKMLKKNEQSLDVLRVFWENKIKI